MQFILSFNFLNLFCPFLGHTHQASSLTCLVFKTPLVQPSHNSIFFSLQRRGGDPLRRGGVPYMGDPSASSFGLNLPEPYFKKLLVHSFLCVLINSALALFCGCQPLYEVCNQPFLCGHGALVYLLQVLFVVCLLIVAPLQI